MSVFLDNIVIDGNIASGKSTVLSNLASDEHLNQFSIINENLSEWKQYLEHFYRDMKKNSLCFQMKVLEHHMKVRQLSDHKIITERSPLSCINVFGKHLYDQELISSLDMELLNSYNHNFGWYPNTVIYIRTPPDICFNRIRVRNRENENIPLDYLECIHDKYEELYSRNYIIPNLYIIDGSRDKDIVYSEVKKIILDNYI